MTPFTLRIIDKDGTIKQEMYIFESFCTTCGWMRKVDARLNYMCADCFQKVHPWKHFWMRLRGKIQRT